MKKKYRQLTRTEDGRRVIKKYRNRKYYDCVLSEYSSLEEMFDLVRNGENIKVIDHNGGDITAKTLLTSIRSVEDKHEDIMAETLISVIRSGRGTFINQVEGVK